MIVTILVAINYFAVAAFFFVRKRKRPFNLLDPAWAFLAGYFMNYCFRPTLFLIDPEVGLWYEGYLNPEAVFRAGLSGALVFALIGFVGFACGDLYCERSALRVSRRLPEPDLRRIARFAPYTVIAALFLALGMAGLWGFIREVGWSGSFLELMTGFQRGVFLQVIYGHGYYTFAMQVSLIGWALMCAKWFVYPKVQHGWRRMVRPIWRCGCLIGALLIWVAFGERLSILTVIFIPFALYFTMGAAQTRRSRQSSLRRWAPVLIVVFVVVAGPVGLLMKQQEVSGPQVANMATSAWDSMEFTVAANKDLRFRDLFWGSSYISDIIYTWYPRAIFPEKPLRYGVVLIQDRLAPSMAASIGASFPPGILVEAYANFWYAGLFFVPLLLAVFCRAVYFRLQANSFFWLVQTALLFPQLASFRSLGWVIAMFMANFFVVVVVIVLCRLARVFTVLPRNLPVIVKSQRLDLSS